MFEIYLPSKMERGVIKNRVFIYPEREGLDVEDKIVGAVAHAIYNFDYAFKYANDIEQRQKMETEIQWINDHLALIFDDEIRNHLSSCFNEKSYLDVYDIFAWKIYLDQKTEYTDRVIEANTNGIRNSLVCFKMGIEKWINWMSDKLSGEFTNYKVVYSDDLAGASVVLKEGIHWFGMEERLHPVTIGADIEKDLHDLTVLMVNNALTVDILKEIFPYQVDVMVTEKFNVVFIKCFYIMLRR